MSERTDIYQNPLISRYSSYEMQHLFSPDVRFSNWRKCWIALAEAEMELGIEQITPEMLKEMRANVENINYDVAKAKERENRHDVMAHLYAYHQQCPAAKGNIHLGATSCFVTDNADILILRDALALIRKKLFGVIKLLSSAADEYKSLPTLGLTHLQPAQPITVGRRMALWLQSFVRDVAVLDFVDSQICLLGCRGATGSSQSFMELFDGDKEKAMQLDHLIAEKLGFEGNVFDISGQTYPRDLDILIMNCLVMISTSAMKMANDIRILQNFKEMEEPFEKTQVGSSAMAYKRNPMRCERICALARYVTSNGMNPIMTAQQQWFERTLDDSANRRLSLGEGFLATDAVLKLCANVVDGIVVYEKMIETRLKAELPFMTTENILMEAVKHGNIGREELHEKIRKYSMEAGMRVKMEGKSNNLFELISADPDFGLSMEDLEALSDPNKLMGTCPEQVTNYLNNVVYPLLEANKEEFTTIDKEVNV